MKKEKSHCQIELGPNGIQERGFFLSEKNQRAQKTTNDNRRNKNKEHHFLRCFQG